MKSLRATQHCVPLSLTDGKFKYVIEAAFLVPFGNRDDVSVGFKNDAPQRLLKKQRERHVGRYAMFRRSNLADATLKAMSFAFVCAATVLFIATAAQASCADRPGTPIWRYPGWNSATSFHLSWINKATETVWWDLEISDEFGNVISSQAGIQPIATTFNANLSMDLNVPLGAQRCFRLKARTESGTGGCVSIQ